MSVFDLQILFIHFSGADPVHRFLQHIEVQPVELIIFEKYIILPAENNCAQIRIAVAPEGSRRLPVIGRCGLFQLSFLQLFFIHCLRSGLRTGLCSRSLRSCLFAIRFLPCPGFCFCLCRCSRLQTLGGSGLCLLLTAPDQECRGGHPAAVSECTAAVDRHETAHFFRPQQIAVSQIIALGDIHVEIRDLVLVFPRPGKGRIQGRLFPAENRKQLVLIGKSAVVIHSRELGSVVCKCHGKRVGIAVYSASVKRRNALHRLKPPDGRALQIIFDTQEGIRRKNGIAHDHHASRLIAVSQLPHKIQLGLVRA